MPDQAPISTPRGTEFIPLAPASSPPPAASSEPTDAPAAPSTDAAAAPAPKGWIERVLDDPWLVHKTMKQAVWRPIYGAAFLPRTIYLYRTYAARFGTDPNEDIFRGDPSARYYNTRTRAGGRIRDALTPQQFHRDDLSKQELKDLRASASSWGRAQANMMQGANYARLAGNIPALISVFSSDKADLKQTTVIVSDTTLSATFIGVQQFYKVGWKYLDLAHKAEKLAEESNRAGKLNAYHSQLARAHDLNYRAYKAFDRGKNLSFISFGVQMIGGAVKVGVEVDNLLRRPEQARLSALVDGAVDAGQGGAYAAYNWYLVRQGAMAARGASLDALRKATDVLSSSAQVIPPKLLWTMRALGVAGCVMGAIPNIQAIYEGATNDALSHDVSQHKVISGSLGLAASLSFLGGALLITPASMPFGAALILVGNGFLVAQTVYDEWENWFGPREYAKAKEARLAEPGPRKTEIFAMNEIPDLESELQRASRGGYDPRELLFQIASA